MKNIMKFTFLSALVAFGIPAAATTSKLECKVTETHSSGGWIPIKPAITYDADACTAVVKFTNRQGETVQHGKIETLNAKRVTFLFNVKDMESSTGQFLPIMQYRATYMFKTNEFRVKAQPVGYSNGFRAKGACKQV